MRIRALTGFLDPDWPVNPDRFDVIAEELNKGRKALENIGCDIQTLRIATPSPDRMPHPVPAEDRAEYARTLEAECFMRGIDYAAIGPAIPEEPSGYSAVPDILAATENVFTSAVYAGLDNGLSLAAAQSCGRIIVSASRLSSDGFANLRFAALANVGPGSPFFPAAYCEPGEPAVAAAFEGASLAVEAFRGAPSVRIARQRLIESIEKRTTAISHTLERTLSEARYLGIDFSLAPYPTGARSLGTAMESMGLSAVGLAGSVTMASMLTECIDQASFKRTGFCGILTAVLEDKVLAERAAAGTLSIKDLLLYSTVCGTGLDTIPLAGDVSEEALSALLVDLGTLALRHNKPLTARLMPIPGKQAGDPIHFNFEYFADSAVMELESAPLNGLLGGLENLEIHPRSV